MSKRGGAALKLYWQVATVSKKRFCYMLFVEIVTVALFEFIGIMAVPLLLEAVVGRHNMLLLVVLLAIGAAYCTRNKVQNLGFQVVKRIIVVGQRILVDKLTASIMKGQIKNEEVYTENTVTRLLYSWERVADTAMLQLLAGVVTLTVNFGILAVKAPVMIVAFLLMGVAYWVAMRNEGDKSAQLADDEAIAEARLTVDLVVMAESYLMYWVTSQAYKRLRVSKELAEQAKIRRFSRSIQQKNKLRWIEFGVFVCIAAFILHQYFIVKSPAYKLAVVVALLLFILHNLGATFINFWSNFVSVKEDLGSAEGICEEILDPPPRLPNLRCMTKPYVVQLEGVEKRGRVYENYELRAGINVLGQYSGWGKTTLLSMIAGVLKPDSGRVLLNGKATLQWDVRRRVVFVVQQPPAFSLQSFYLFAKAKEDEASDVLTRLGLDSSALTKGLGRVSGGQARLLYTAAALHYASQSRPSVLAFDEPTAGLDAVKTSKVLGAIRAFHNDFPDCIIVIASHDERVWGIATGGNLFLEDE